MKSKLPIGVYKAPSSGLTCPACLSNNTAFGEGTPEGCKWSCFDCGEVFDREDAGNPPQENWTVYGVSEMGIYKTNGSRVIFISNETIEEDKKAQELREAYLRSPEWLEWKAKWDEICRGIDQRAQAEAYVKSLTPDALNKLKENLDV